MRLYFNIVEHWQYSEYNINTQNKVSRSLEVVSSSRRVVNFQIIVNKN
jgi:hypothetical protein